MGDYLKRKVLQVSKFQPEIEIKTVNIDIDHIQPAQSNVKYYSSSSSGSSLGW
jgi:hypothetical protein